MPPRRRHAHRAGTIPFPGTPADGVEIKVTVDQSTRTDGRIEVDLRDNPGLHAVTASISARPRRARRRCSACSTRSIARRAEERRQLSPDHACICARTASVGIPRHPTSLLGRDHQHRRPRRQPRAGRDRRTRRRAGAGGDRARACPPRRRDLRHRSAHRRAVRQRSLSRHHRRCRCADHRWLALHHACRQRRRVLPGQHRARRTAPADLRRRAPAAARHRGAGSLPRRPRRAIRGVRPDARADDASPMSATATSIPRWARAAAGLADDRTSFCCVRTAQRKPCRLAPK